MFGSAHTSTNLTFSNKCQDPQLVSITERLFKRKEYNRIFFNEGLSEADEKGLLGPAAFSARSN